MTTRASELLPINIMAGVQPSTDRTSASTTHYVSADKIRFVGGFPQKIGGHVAVSFDYGKTISGVPRSIYSETINNNSLSVIGTHSYLYSLFGTQLTNITPLQASTVAIANSIATHYGTLATDPITAVNGSKTLTIADTLASRLVAGDSVTLSGSSDVAGISAATINAAHVVRSVGANSFTIYVSTAATSSASGGGASVVRASGLLRFSATSHAQANGDRTKILDASDTGGIVAADINLEFIIRNVASGTFDVMTTGVATSAVTGGGGASVTYQKQIAAGSQNENFGQGYGCGLYGMGLYGTALKSVAAKAYPRTWFFDRFAEAIIMTPGNQTGVYTWAGSNVAAPSLLSGAPAAVNYVFVSNNIVVTFGAGGINNHILTSDQGTPTNWTASSTNQVFEDYVEGAGRLKSHLPASGQNLIFTDTQVYRFRYIGVPLVWEIKLLDNSVGIISPRAGCSVNDVAFWMGQKNWYMWKGANISIIPANSQAQSTIFNYVFKNLTGAQKSKIFCRYNEAFNEIEWYYPSAGSSEPDRVARLCLDDFSWTMDTAARTAAEYPFVTLSSPYLINSTGTLYKHEVGNDADGAALAWSLVGPRMTKGKPSSLLAGVVPDSIQTGNITLQIDTYKRQQSSTPVYSETFTVAPTTEEVPVQVGGRWWQYTLSGSSVGQEWKAGNWMEFVQRGAEN